jgi:hypothetical protein
MEPRGDESHQLTPSRSGAAVIVGGPMMVDYLRPSDEELRAKYNPELRARAEEEHEGRQQDFDNFVSKLKVAARSDKQIWTVLADMEKDEKKKKELRIQSEAAEVQAQRDEMRRQAGLPEVKR